MIVRLLRIAGLSFAARGWFIYGSTSFEPIASNHALLILHFFPFILSVLCQHKLHHWVVTTICFVTERVYRGTWNKGYPSLRIATRIVISMTHHSSSVTKWSNAKGDTDRLCNGAPQQHTGQPVWSYYHQQQREWCLATSVQTWRGRESNQELTSCW